MQPLNRSQTDCAPLSPVPLMTAARRERTGGLACPPGAPSPSLSLAVLAPLCSLLALDQAGLGFRGAKVKGQRAQNTEERDLSGTES